MYRFSQRNFIKVGKIGIALLSFIICFLHRVLVINRREADLICHWNDGISFGIDLGAGIHEILLMTFVLFLTIGVIYFIYSKQAILALLMLCLGAIGNIGDRIQFGKVCDYIDLSAISDAFGFLPIFNLNDILISISLFTIVIISLNKK